MSNDDDAYEHGSPKRSDFNNRIPRSTPESSAAFSEGARRIREALGHPAVPTAPLETKDTH